MRPSAPETNNCFFSDRRQVRFFSSLPKSEALVHFQLPCDRIFSRGRTYFDTSAPLHKVPPRGSSLLPLFIETPLESNSQFRVAQVPFLASNRLSRSLLSLYGNHFVPLGRSSFQPMTPIPTPPPLFSFVWRSAVHLFPEPLLSQNLVGKGSFLDSACPGPCLLALLP